MFSSNVPFRNELSLNISNISFDLIYYEILIIPINYLRQLLCQLE